MDESTHTEKRQVLSFADRSAKIKARQLWHDDLNSWIAFVKDNTVIVGQLKKIRHEIVGGGDRGIGRSGITVVLKPNPPHNQEHEIHELQSGDEVWVMDEKPEVSINGVYLKDKGKR